MIPISTTALVGADPLYPVHHPEEMLSPSLLIFRDLLRRNLRSMIAMVGDPSRLRPHVKTHKMPAIIRLAESMGIRKHKCATIAEAEMVAASGGTDILLAYPVVGPNLARLARLTRLYPSTTIRATVDHPDSARQLSAALEPTERPLPTLIDLDVGMGRTGIAPGDEAASLYGLIDSLPNLVADGMHAYDGQIRDQDLDARRASAAPGLDHVRRFRDLLLSQGLAVPRVVLGGTPTFPIHAGVLDIPGAECSPGTSVLHDAGYSAKFPDLPFVPAAVLLTRVVSLPRPGRVCLDLGHKAVAADPVGARLTLPGLPGASLGGQSEEHLVVELAEGQAGELEPGSALLAIPTHICPTCALHSWAYVLEGGEIVDRWEVRARDRVLGI